MTLSSDDPDIHIIRGQEVYRRNDGLVQIGNREPMPIKSAAVFLAMEEEHLNNVL